MTKKRARAKTLGDFIILTTQQIGKGSFATVYKGFRRADKKSVAIKVISRSRLTEKLLNSVQFEIDTLRKIQHSNIIRLYDFKVGVFDDDDDEGWVGLGWLDASIDGGGN